MLNIMSLFCERFPVSIILLMIIISPEGCRGQHMDPKVTITETSPPATGFKVRGFLAEDVLLNCYVENLPTDLTVRWQRTMFDKFGRETVIGISVDMDLQDNMKWSIEKPTPYSWRLRIRALEVADEGNYTCYVVLTSNNNRVLDNRTVIVTDKPIILEEFSTSDFTAKEGEFVAMRCNASGRPYPTIMWRREGNAILPGGGVIMMGSAFDIPSVQYDARGRYFCEAMNEVGEDRREIKLTVLHDVESPSAKEQKSKGKAPLSKGPGLTSTSAAKTDRDLFNASTDEDEPSTSAAKNDRDLFSASTDEDEPSTSAAKNDRDLFNASTDEDEPSASAVKNDRDLFNASTDEELMSTENGNESDGQLPELPNYFGGKSFFLYGNFSQDNRRTLIRYIVAYNGMVIDYMDASIDYVVTDEVWDDHFDQALSENGDLIFVKSSWVFSCHEAQRALPHQKFLVTA